jgi:pyrophosphatase PpaX
MTDMPVSKSSRRDAPRRGILFDLDGTLVDTYHLYIQSFRRTLETHFKRPVSEAEIMALQPSAERRLLQSVIGHGDFSAQYDRFLVQYRTLHATLFEGVYPGVSAMLTELRSRGWLLGLVTGKSRAAWDITAAAAGLPAFDAVVTDDDVRDGKPDPEGIHRALDMLQVSPARAWYVGDSMLDCRAAVAAGVAFAAGLWAKGAEERAGFAEATRRAGGRLQVEYPKDVPSALEQDGWSRDTGEHGGHSRTRGTGQETTGRAG